MDTEEIRIKCLELSLDHDYLSQSQNPSSLTTEDIIKTASKFEVFIKGESNA